ncbi:MAG: ATP-binding protein [Myxococcota bacterium]
MTERKPFILYVDDNRANRIVFEQSFRSKFAVRTVETAQEALHLLKTEEVSVIVTDQRMPGMSGNELLERAKTDSPNSVRIVVTAYSDLDAILRAVNEGLVSRYVLKPWVSKDLERMLAWATEIYQLSRENSHTRLRLLETERLVTLGSISAAVVHDINQPLSYLYTGTEHLAQIASSCMALGKVLDRHGHELSTKDKDNLKQLCQDLPGLVEDMFTGCKMIRDLNNTVGHLCKAPQSGPHRSAPKVAIRFAISVCRKTNARSRPQIDYEGPEDLPTVNMDASELIQTLINVISNAVQAVERKEGKPSPIVVKVADAGDFLQIQIIDRGVGMPPGVLKKIGTPFFTTRHDGTGLGVNQCRRLIEQVGGTIEFDSIEGYGTTVTLTLRKVSG